MRKPYKNPLGGPERYDANGAAQVSGLVTAFRDDFNGVALNPDEWNVQLGAGMAINVAGGELSISSGVTANSETIITGKTPFTVPFRLWFIMRMSQRIANQEFYLEAVNAASDMLAQWLLDGVTSTAAKIDAKNGGNTSAGAVAYPINFTGVDGILETQLFPDECWFRSQLADSNAGRNLGVVRTRNIPDPNDEYFIRIRVKNLGVAPASSTNLVLGAVCGQDINEVPVEVTGGQGNGVLAQSIPVSLPSGASISVPNGYYNDSVTPLAASAAFTGTVRDCGVSGGAVQRFTATAFADQAGTLYIDMSNDNVTWRQAKKTPVVAGDSAELSAVAVTRYFRARFVNGAAAQAAFMLNSSVGRI